MTDILIFIIIDDYTNISFHKKKVVASLRL